MMAKTTGKTFPFTYGGAYMKTREWRLRKKAKCWRELLATEPECFKVEWWSDRVGKWVADAGRIAQQYRCAGADKPDPELRRKRIFEVVDRARQFLYACGPEVVQAVGQQTIAYLQDECARLVANSMAPHLRNLTIDYARYRPKARAEKRGPRGAP